MIPLLLRSLRPTRLYIRIRVDQRTQLAPVNDQPGNKSSELCWGEHVYFEHGDGVRADRLVEEFINAQLGDWKG